MKKLLRVIRSQKFYSLFASVFNSAVAVVTFAFLARALTKDDFGLWGFFLTVVGLVEMGMFGLIKTPLIRMIASHDEEDHDKIVSAAWQIALMAVLVSTLVLGIGLVVTWLINHEVIYLHYIYWIFLYLFLSLPRQVGIWLCNARMRFDLILRIRLISTIVFLVLIAVIYFTGVDLMFVFWSYALAILISSVYTSVMGLNGFSKIFKAAGHLRTEMFKFGRYSMGTTLGAASLASSDSIIVMFLLGPEFLAIYQIPRRINSLYDIPLRAVLQFAYPQLSKRTSEAGSAAFRNSVERMIGFTILALFPVALLIFIFAGPITYLLGGAEYADAIPVVRVFSLFLAISSLDRFSGIILDVLGRPHLNFTKTLVMLTVNVVADVIAIKMGYGVFGVAAVTTITACAGIIYGFFKHREEVAFRPITFLRAGFVQLRNYLPGRG